MPATDRDHPSRPPPPVALALLRVLLPRAERAEVLADMTAEYAEHAAARGSGVADRWLGRQALHSVPALLRWGWWRGWSGFEPHANVYQPGGPMWRSWIADVRYAARRLRTRPALVAMLAAMGLILLIACANVAALMLGQVEGRSAELAVRAALGANRRRLTQQVVVEALLVGAAAGAVGAALAAAGFGVLARALPTGAWGESAAFVGVLVRAIGTIALARLLTSFLFGVSAVDPLAFAAAGAALLVTGVVAAFVPVWRTGTTDPALVLREQ